MQVAGAVLSASVTAGGVVLTLEGDGDRILLSGVQDITDLAFV
jgi:hypothetical protein